MKTPIIKTIIAAGIFIGSIQPAAAYSDYCREYNYNVSIGNAPAPAYGTACYQPDGSWKIGESEFQQISYYSPQPVHVNHVRYITTREYAPPLFSISFGNRGHYYPHYYNHRHNKHWNNHRRYDKHNKHRGRSGNSYVQYKHKR